MYSLKQLIMNMIHKHESMYMNSSNNLNNKLFNPIYSLNKSKKQCKVQKSKKPNKSYEEHIMK